MALCINWIFGVFFVLTSHPLHMSVTNIEYNESRELWEVSIKLFKDDFSSEMMRLYSIDPELEKVKAQEGEKEDLEERLIFDKFISDHFGLEINGLIIGVDKWNYLDKKLNEEAVWLNYSFSFEDIPLEVKIKNTMMFGMFQDQKNLLIFTYRDKQKAYQFRVNKADIQFSIN